MYAVGEYTYAPYKVVWNRMGDRLTACVVSSVNDKFLGNKLILPENVLAFIPVDNEDEAHYLCAILNSSITDLTLRSIAGDTKNFGIPKMIEDTLNIPKFNAGDKIYVKLSCLSKKAYQLAQQGREEEVRKVEEEMSRTVAQLYGITDDKLEEIKKYLATLECGGVEGDKRRNR